MSQFSSKWDKPRSSPSLGKRIRERIRPPEPLRPRIELATRQIEIQISKLEATSAKLKDKDATLFSKVVLLIRKHDTQHANMIANELSEIRKMSKIVTQAKLALEQVTLRLGTIKEMGDIAVALSPAMGVLKSVRSGISCVVPEGEGEISEISGLLSGILVDASQISSTSINFESANEEAEKVLVEAGVIAERNIRERFPDLPIQENPAFEAEVA